jgi:ParB-like chromosome segregation protein Spo0J
MPRMKQTALLEGGSAVQESDEKLLTLLQRLGIETFPAHETMSISIERIRVPGAELVHPPPRLVKSIKRVGVLQNPSVVLLTGAGLHDPEATFEVIFGRRRILGAALAGRSTVKCEAYASGTPQLSSLLGLIENEQRSAAWIKEVSDLRRLIDEKVGMTLDDLAAFGFDRGQLCERLKIAQLPQPFLVAIMAGEITQSMAKKLVRLTTGQRQRLEQVLLSGEKLTEETVKSALRMQVNAGLSPLQFALEASMSASAVAPSPPPSEGTSPGAAALPPPSLVGLRAALASFEHDVRPGPSTLRLRLLLRALKQEIEVAARQPGALLKPAGEEEVLRG